MAVPVHTAEQTWTELLEGNQRFIHNRPQPRDLASERAAVAAVQHPKAIVLTCSDSRVAPEIIFDQKLGDLFVVRVAGNTADRVALGTIEYAARELCVKMLVVLGHKRCGAVAAAASAEKVQSPNLKAVIRRIQPACEQVHRDGADTSRAAERLNVTNAVRDALSASTILGDLTRAGTLTIIPAYYDLDTGEVLRLA